MSEADPFPFESLYRGPAFRAIERILREDPALASGVKTWRSREGEPDDMSLPSIDMMPIVSLSPMPVGSTILGLDETKIRLDVSVRVAVPGTRVEHILGLWEAIESAIVGTKPFRVDAGGNVITVKEYLCSVLSGVGRDPRGVHVLRPTMPGFFDVNIRRADNEPSFQWGDGALTCFLSRPA